ncbi:GNAT family N-acetyltransferase [Rossellomorea marisflavi]|uniref:GNAT family N-acetyltransferase n=1 Tax=Rossellomorea marisflavi TaxID=189381 RepID=UPI00279996B9|nr:GNAT family N-acetyltransferase [Rossellomorea marisflavi]UTE73405.1 GNAT family N-acetyltransferase [Rossellomorea marisflavi]
MKNFEDKITFEELSWDSEFFGVSSAKATLHKKIEIPLWNNLKTRFKDYQFISIINMNSDSSNAQFIGRYTSAFLIDVNIQFKKDLKSFNELPPHISIQQMKEENQQIVDLAEFDHSKFTEDPNLAIRGGAQVYKNWISNSFNKQGKFFAVSKDTNSKINGFTLFSFSNGYCIVELIAVSKENTKRRVGTSLFNAVESVAFKNGYKHLKVGTQIRNIAAINFYHKMGCKQEECNQVFHLWNNTM